MALSFRLLGDLEVRTGGALVAVGPPRQQNVLSCLLVDANQVVATDRIIERVWGHRPPGGRDAVYPYLSRIRQVLDRAGRGCLRRRDGGYVLEVDPADVDVHHFRALVGRARDTGPEQRFALLEQACELWRGEPFPLLDSPWAAMVRDRLQEEWLSVTLERLDLAVTLGRCAESVDELTELADRHPLVERVTGLLMRALHGTGRRADALSRFHRMRAALDAELGIDPSDELHHICRSILRDEGRPPAGPATRPRALPRAVPDFTGRAADVEAIRHIAELATDRGGVAVCAISGMPGVGKSTFAVHAAHRLAERFPDGQLYLDLHGHGPRGTPLNAAAALRDLLCMIGTPAQEIPDDVAARATRWRTATAGRRLLLVLDDAVSAEQVRPLLPSTPGSLVLITSRRRLVGLEASNAIVLDTLGPAEAAELFAAMAGDRATVAPLAVAEVVERCAFLPLAVRIAAARLTHRPLWTVEDLAARLRDEERRLTELSTGDRGVASAFALSYRHLDSGVRRVFRLLGLHPGPDFDVHAAAALCDRPVAEVEAALEELLDANLLLQRDRGRYHCHDLVRQFAIAAGQSADPEGERTIAVDRVRDYYLATAAVAMRLVEPTEQRIDPDVRRSLPLPTLTTAAAAERWLTGELPNLVRVALGTTGRHSWLIPHLIRDFFYLQCRYDDWLTTHLHALAVARAAGDRRAEAITSVGIGFAYYRVTRLADAQTAYERAVELQASLEPGQLATAVNNLGILHWYRDSYRQAIPLHRRARELYRSAGHTGGEAYALFAFGHAVARLGHPDVATSLLHRSVDLTRHSGRRYGEAIALAELGAVRTMAGDHETARKLLRESLSLSRAGRLRWSEISALRGLGQVAAACGRHADAIRHYTDALHHAEAINERVFQCELLNHLGCVHRAMGEYASATYHHERALAVAQTIGLARERHRATGELAAMRPRTAAGAVSR